MHTDKFTISIFYGFRIVLELPAGCLMRCENEVTARMMVKEQILHWTGAMLYLLHSSAVLSRRWRRDTASG